MNINALKAALANGMELESRTVYVRVSNQSVNPKAQQIAAFSAKVYRKNAGWIELCASGKKRSLVSSKIKGLHRGAEKALRKLGYEIEFAGVNANGDSTYLITNL
jgi:hypothetical protein